MSEQERDAWMQCVVLGCHGDRDSASFCICINGTGRAVYNVHLINAFIVGSKEIQRRKKMNLASHPLNIDLRVVYRKLKKKLSIQTRIYIK